MHLTIFLNVIQKASEIEQFSSNNLSQEKTWIEDVLHKFKTDVDVQSESFNCFLYDKLYKMLDNFLEIFKQMKATVDDLSKSTDLTVRKHFHAVH